MRGRTSSWPRAWALRHNLTIYDATYVALAETKELRLVTLDKRLANTSGSTCQMLTP